MEKIYSKGRTFVNGCALSQDLRKLIVDEIVRNGGISTQATLQANFSSGMGSIGADFIDFFMQMSKYRLSIFYGNEP